MFSLYIIITLFACALSFCFGARYANKKAISNGYVVYKDVWYLISKRRW
jgi:hypothetical protein